MTIRLFTSFTVIGLLCFFNSCSKEDPAPTCGSFEDLAYWERADTIQFKFVNNAELSVSDCYGGENYYFAISEQGDHKVFRYNYYWKDKEVEDVLFVEELIFQVPLEVENLYIPSSKFCDYVVYYQSAEAFNVYSYLTDGEGCISLNKSGDDYKVDINLPVQIKDGLKNNLRFSAVFNETDQFN